MSLAGRQVLITGASRGLGAAIAGELVADGASVLLVARDTDALERTAAGLRARASAGQRVITALCDVADPQAVSGMARQALAVFPDLAAVVNNAGQIGPLGCLEDNDLAAWQQTLAVNLLGPVAICHALLPHFRRRGEGRIVNLSGGGATGPLPHHTAYASAKAGLVRFTETLARELATTGITVNAVAPGALDTDMTQVALAAGPAAIGAEYHARLQRMIQAPDATPAEAAALCAWLCSPASGAITGRLISARWDRWRELAGHADDLAGTDIYTLRRIVPADRGRNWEA